MSALESTTPASAPTVAAVRWRERLPGIAVAAMLALAAAAVAGGLGDPLARNPLLVAILVGLAIGNTFGCPDTLKPGLDFTKRTLLRLAVVLVGFRVTTRLLWELGAAPLAIAALELLIVLGAMWWLAHRLLKLDRDLALLLAAGSAVCGASAVLAVAGVVRARPQQAAIAVTLITVFGTLALLGAPWLYLGGWLPRWDDELFGIFVGASLFEVPQVIGAAIAVSDQALNTATLVKLVKVVLLVPLLFTLVWLRRRAAGAEAGRATVPFPWFVVVFVAVMLLNSALDLPGPLKATIQDIDLFLFLMVMTALGLDTRLARLKAEGGAPRLLALGVLALVVSSAVAFALVTALAGPPTAAPAQNGAAADAGMRQSTGGRIFDAVGCAKCHVPTLPAGKEHVVLYSDLLLHAMGPALDDKITQGDATGRDWRTAPLVGLGLRQRYLHDGRATTLADAIAAHGGEAEIVRDRFWRLAPAEQAEVIRFLQGL
jgi:uncharacterized integral membrane protein (TIGR00698 family)